MKMAFAAKQGNEMKVFRALPVLLVALLASCATASPSDAVRSESTAIEIAKKACDWEKVENGRSWHARLREGIWHVWLNTEYQRDESKAINSLEIRASDGFTKGCPIVT
jgi:hypothetical protein